MGCGSRLFTTLIGIPVRYGPTLVPDGAASASSKVRRLYRLADQDFVAAVGSSPDSEATQPEGDRYSARNDSTGSSMEARRAGATPATSPMTDASAIASTAYMTGVWTGSAGTAR